MTSGRLALFAIAALWLAACSDVRDKPVPDNLGDAASYDAVARTLKPDELQDFVRFLNYWNGLAPPKRLALKGTTYRQAIQVGADLKQKEGAAAARVRAEVGDPNLQFMLGMRIGSDGSVCGTIRNANPTLRSIEFHRTFVALPNGEVHVSEGRPPDIRSDEFKAYQERHAQIQVLEEIHCLDKEPGDQLLHSAGVDYTPPVSPEEAARRAAAAALVPDRPVLFERNPENRKQPSDAAIASAVDLGAAGDVAGLRAIVELRSLPLLQAYARGYASHGGEHPAGMEQAMTVAVGVDQLRVPSLRILASWPECQVRYGDRALFDALRSQLALHNEESVAGALLCTSLDDLDQPLADTLSKLKDPRPATLLVDYLGKRRSPVAVPALITIQKAIPNDGSTGLQREVDRALVAIGTDESIDAIRQRIRWLTDHASDKYAAGEAGSVAAILASVPPDLRLPYPSIRPLWKTFSDVDTQRSFLKLVRRWGLRESIPDLYDALDAERGPEAAEAILELGDAADWKRLDQWVASGNRGKYWSGPQSTSLREHIHLAASQPDKEIASRVTRNRQAAFDSERQRIAIDERLAQALKDTAPRTYFDSFNATLQRTVRLANDYPDLDESKRTLHNALDGYRHQAGFARLTLHDPRAAIAEYERAIALGAQLEATGGTSRSGCIWAWPIRSDSI